MDRPEGAPPAPSRPGATPDATAGATAGATARLRPALRHLFWLTFLPTTIVFLTGFAWILTMVERVHTDVQRTFEEAREARQVRSLVDELRGFQRWVHRIGHVSAEWRQAAADDAREHLDNAMRILAERRPADDDPSDPEHAAVEAQLRARILDKMPALQRLLDDPTARLEDARPDVDEALDHARDLASAIEQANAELGASLDQRSGDIVHLVLLLGGLAAATLAFAAFLLHRRILGPLARLRDGAVRFGHGDLDAPLPVHLRDEIGQLARTMQTMAERIRAHQSDLEARVEQRTRELLRTARLADLGTLAAGVAHEINNPLAAIATCAEGLLRDELAAAGDAGATRASRVRDREYLEIIAKEAMRVRDTTQRLLELARPESGRREAVWLDRELDEVAKMLQHSAQRRGVHIEVEPANGAPPAHGDPADLRQVLFNLVKNAVDASPAGATVRTRLRADADRVILDVLDEGSGVDRELGDRIFEPFVTTKDPGQGTGLGLPISHRIVADHQGRLTVLDRDGGGTCFRVELPRHGD